MKQLGLNEIREKFLVFFESKNHLRLKSFSLVPQNDKSLLVINSGMAPLKAYFTGLLTPPSVRMTNCQKCVRTNDIDNVGITSRHATFFEMLGNFSFGDYFKKEIIPWSWEFLTEVMDIPAEKLAVSVYLDDDEAFDIWNKNVGLPVEKITRLGKEDNFWEVGLGPCGPSSEIYFDRGIENGCGKDTCGVGCDCDRFIEIWNLVFTQFSKEEDGSYSKLSKPNIDTGMGLERIALVMQGVNSIFDIDTLKAVRDEVCRISGKNYNADELFDYSIRVITDHVRSIVFMTSDGIIPSNEGLGYILRRLLRRAARHGRLLGIKGLFLKELAETAVAVSKTAYPELEEKKEYIYKLIAVEESRFAETIDTGMELLKTHIGRLKEKLVKELAGDEAFKLYDTYGFPLELMEEILKEHGFGVDVSAFRQRMDEQRERGRANRGEASYMGADETVFDKLDKSLVTEFLGYEKTSTDAKIIGIVADNNIANEANEGSQVAVITDKTTLYAESGGQKGDGGFITTSTGTVEITDCLKVQGNKSAALGKVIKGSIKLGDVAEVTVDPERRNQTARHHSATHLLHKALKQVLGNHVEQSGSLVSSDRLRFDFAHFSPVTSDELQRIEDIVNTGILNGLAVETIETSIDDAKIKGASALFGEKYGSIVRMVSMGEFSVELCGGTHVKNTAQIGAFKILSENGIAAGVRRIEAIAGTATLEYFRRLEESVNAAAALFKASPENLLARLENHIASSKELGRELEKHKRANSKNAAEELLSSKEVINGVNVLIVQHDGLDMNGLREMGDKLRDKIASGVIVLASINEDKAALLCMATEDAVKKNINAGLIIKEAALSAGGSGGGKPNMAQAGIKDIDKLGNALIKAKEVIEKQLSL